jgi:adenylylsulfate reductase, subunit B
MPPILEKNRCTACGHCVDICPMDVFYGSGENDIPVMTYPEECWHCNACVMECPVAALQLRIPLPATVLFKSN